MRLVAIPSQCITKARNGSGVISCLIDWCNQVCMCFLADRPRRKLEGVPAPWVAKSWPALHNPLVGSISNQTDEHKVVCCAACDPIRHHSTSQVDKKKWNSSHTILKRRAAQRLKTDSSIYLRVGHQTIIQTQGMQSYA